jgi:hypothetical protein
MIEERFQILADAYGGDIDRWPADEQAAARAWSAAHVKQALAILEDASSLDMLLDMAEAPVVSPVLRDRIVASALEAHRPMRRTLMWASATGLMAACLAGVMLGTHLSDRLLSDPAAEAVTQTATAFADQGSYFDTSTTTTTTATGTTG